MSKIAIFPGTFDPITFGHEDLIRRSSKIFSQVIIAVAQNAHKSPILDLTKRIELINKSVTDLDNVKVLGFSGLLVDFARENKANVIIRGVRVVTDFEYELQLAHMNRCLDQNLEIVFVVPSQNYAYISSTMVKELVSLGGDVSAFVNKNVQETLMQQKWR